MNTQFIKIYLYFIAVFLLITVVFNYVIDPYGIHQAFVIEGVNKHKPERYANTPQSKLINMLNMAPNTLLLGTSRTEFGIDPDMVPWPMGAKPIYNMALGLSNFTEMNYIIDELIKVKSPSKVIIGIDFISFSTVKKSKNLRFNIDKNTSVSFGWSLLSLGSLKASIETILSQNEYSHVNYKYNGVRTSRSYDLSLEENSHRGLFNRMNNRYDYNKVLSHGMESNIVKSNFKALIKLLKKLKDNNINTVVFFTPIHLDLLKKIYNENAWGSFVEIKRKLTLHLNENVKTVELWDFARINGVTTEIIPDKLGGSMKWYYDSAHYKPSLGQVVMSEILNSKELLGVRLEVDNVDRILDMQTKSMVDHLAK